uniref:uncharacterized protein LOC101243529 n=1 Tax=Ciona intestinalis TaxID=7719 RepID=UPI0002B8CF20|nr:uncharacterized protein LOC101243529 [Ciona intestinalis]XP_026690503.1 uncharacterized protein LOC101243529 [Ciona intestinalis]|eukprot:XP_004226059.1 uncharacterized protein LOC101243529 [Ciona intestinalis]
MDLVRRFSRESSSSSISSECECECEIPIEDIWSPAIGLEILLDAHAGYKAWPKQMIENGNVYVQNYPDTKYWTSWINGNFFIFSVKLTSGLQLYLSPTTGRNGRPGLKIIQGNEPSRNSPGTDDPRVFEYKLHTHSQQHVLYNKSTGQYIGLNRRNRMIPVGQEKQAGAFTLSSPELTAYYECIKKKEESKQQFCIQGVTQQMEA